MSLFSMQQMIILIICALSFANGEPRHRSPQVPVEAAEVFDKFASVVAIFDIDQDGELECLTAVRTDYDRTAHSAKYVWLLKGLDGRKPRNETYLVIPGAKQGEFLVKDVDSDGPLKIGYYDYTDYKSCLVMRMPYRSYEECVLWVTEEVKDHIPQNCKDYFEDNCEDAKLAYDKESCSAVDISSRSGSK